MKRSPKLPRQRLKIDRDKKVARIVAPSAKAATRLIQNAIDKGESPDFRAITLKPRHDSNIITMFRGKHIDRFLRGEFDRKIKPGVLKDKIMEATKPATEPCRAAGVIIYCAKTKRFLLQERAKGIPGEGMLACFGGRMEPNETPAQAAAREAMEEGKVRIDPDDLVPLSVFESPELVFHNFLIVVKNEFEPKLKLEECASFIWLPRSAMKEFDLLPELTELFENDPMLKRIISEKKTGTAYERIVESIMRG